MCVRATINLRLRGFYPKRALELLTFKENFDFRYCHPFNTKTSQFVFDFNFHIQLIVRRHPVLIEESRQHDDVTEKVGGAGIHKECREEVGIVPKP